MTTIPYQLKKSFLAVRITLEVIGEVYEHLVLKLNST